LVARVDFSFATDLDVPALDTDPVGRWDGRDGCAVVVMPPNAGRRFEQRSSKEDTTMRPSTRGNGIGRRTTVGLSALIANATACVDEDVDAPGNYDTDSDTGMCEPEPQDGE